MNNDTFDFSEALRLLRQGKRLTRKQFGTTCYVKLKQFEPVQSYTGVISYDYIEMIKRERVFADDLPDSERLVCFPFSPSSESLLADDWYEVTGEFFSN